MNNIERYLKFPCVKLSQPIGDFYLGSIKAKDLCEITTYDFRRLVTEEGFSSYLGIQRKLSPQRVKDIAKYVGTKDACFPTAVILSVSAKCAEFDEGSRTLRLTPFTDDTDESNHIKYDEMAVVLDGQHRIAGLKDGSFEGDFDINVSVFVDVDIADQAYIFSTVNLAQTKVNKSLVYDLFDLAKKRSPQKSCHNIAVALDRESASPFFQKIKRLGVATEGRFNETITQSTFVESLLQYVSRDPVTDRNLYLNDKVPPLADSQTLNKLIFRNMFLEQMDLQITDNIWNFFDAVRKAWPEAWESTERGMMLNKSNGFRALMRFLRPSYLNITSPGNVATVDQFKSILLKTNFPSTHFTIDEYKPGTSGESKLYHALIDKSGIQH